MEKDKEGKMLYYEVGLHKCMFWHCNALDFRLNEQVKEFLELLGREVEEQEEDPLNVTN